MALPQLFSAAVAALLGLIARHGHLRRVPGPVVVGAWQLARSVQDRVAAILGRIAAGMLRRHPARRRPSPSGKPRARAARPPEWGWLVKQIPEAAQGAGLLSHALHQPGVAELLQQAPQLRRALRPLCRMLGVRPPTTPPTTPPAPPPAAPPDTPTPPDPPHPATPDAVSRSAPAPPAPLICQMAA